MGNTQTTKKPLGVQEEARKKQAPQEGSTSYMWIGISIGIILLLGFLYTIFYPAKSTTVFAAGPFDLLAPGNNRNSVFSIDSSNKMMIKDADESVQFFVYLDGTLRVGQSIYSGSNGPSHDTGLYNKCQCLNNNDCTNCLPHTGYQTIMNIQNTFVLEILNTPDASRPNAVAAQIYVKTQISNNFNIETFPLPPLPEQKWTMVTISKQGRQISVYYNTKLVLAKKAQNNFATQTPNCAPISVGSNSLSGKVAMVTYFSSNQRLNDVAVRYQMQTDTRGNLISMQVVPTPSFYTLNDKSSYNFVKTLCLDLSCFNFLTKTQTIPTSPYNRVFDTQYA